MPETTPIHPPSKSPLIPVIRIHPDGRQQRYWVSLKRFMEERERGTKIQRIPRKQHKSVLVPEEKIPVWEMEFLENMEDFGVAGLEIKSDKFEVEIKAEVTVKKNGELVNTYPIKVKREAVAREILKKLMR